VSSRISYTDTLTQLTSQKRTFSSVFLSNLFSSSKCQDITLNEMMATSLHTCAIHYSVISSYSPLYFIFSQVWTASLYINLFVSLGFRGKPRMYYSLLAYCTARFGRSNFDHGTFRDLLHAANLRHGTHGFTSLPKEGVLRNFPPLKIRRLRPGLNPRTWVPEASTLTPRPPKPLIFVYTINTNYSE
jgi:hypothetical protein